MKKNLLFIICLISFGFVPAANAQDWKSVSLTSVGLSCQMVGMVDYAKQDGGILYSTKLDSTAILSVIIVDNNLLGTEANATHIINSISGINYGSIYDYILQQLLNSTSGELVENKTVNLTPTETGRQVGISYQDAKQNTLLLFVRMYIMKGKLVTFYINNTSNAYNEFLAAKNKFLGSVQKSGN
jgi:hypothetical protein